MGFMLSAATPEFSMDFIAITPFAEFGNGDVQRFKIGVCYIVIENRESRMIIR